MPAFENNSVIDHHRFKAITFNAMDSFLKIMLQARTSKQGIGRQSPSKASRAPSHPGAR